MGVDVMMKARPFGRMTQTEFEELRSSLHAAWPDEHAESRYRYPDVQWPEYEEAPIIELLTLFRYYGPGYERGHWPWIRDLGDWFAKALGERAEMRYGGDCDDEWERLTPWGDARRENDAHWAEFENRPYWMNRMPVWQAEVEL